MRSLPKCIVVFALLALVALPACGGGGGGAGGDSVATLSGVPTIDLSNYDYSTSGASAMVAAKEKGLGDNVGAEGRFSRAGCEASSHKQHIIMESKMVQLSRCYPEAMDAAGLITIPSGSYGYYRILVPESLMVDDPNDQPETSPELPDQCVALCPSEPPPQECLDCVEQHCQAIPDDPVCDELQQYLAQVVRQQNPVAEIILMRLGRFENGTALHVDMCKESQVDGSVRRTEESTYTASGESIVATIIHKDQYEGESFNMAFDITFTGASVDADGIATLGAGGSAVADGRFIDPYGEGHIHFEALADTRSNVLYGTFSGNFEDAFLGGTQQFTDKMYAQFGGADRTGTGKWFYSGTFPAFPVSLMVPEGISDAELADFLSFMSQELGVPLSQNEGDQYYYGDVFTCPPANCTPESPPEDCAPVVDDGDGICVENGRTGVESFRIAGTPPNQTFTIIPDALSAFFDAVDAYDIAALSADVGTIDYARSWDCTPANEWTVIDPSEYFGAQVAAEREVNATVLQNRIQGCMQLEEQARAGGGMGEYRCHQEEMGDDIEGEGMNDEGEFDFNPWEPVACDPLAQGDGGPLDDIWDGNVQGIQTPFPTFAELQDACEICRDTLGAGEGAVDEQQCEAVLDAFKHLGPR